MRKNQTVEKITTRELTDKTAAWLLKYKKDSWLYCSFVFSEVEIFDIKDGANERIDLFGVPKLPSAYHKTLPILIEVKVSRQDFLKNAGKRLYTGPAHRYYTAPKGLIKVEELPYRWGLIEYSGGRFYITRGSGEARFNEFDAELFYEVLRRRLATFHSVLLCGTKPLSATHVEKCFRKLILVDNTNWYDIPEYLGYVEE